MEENIYVGSPPKRVAPSRKSWNANCVKWWLIKEKKGRQHLGVVDPSSGIN